jgi:hypothetical protein
MFLSTDNLMRALNIACWFHHEDREDIVITVIHLEAADLDAHNVTHAEAIAKLLGLPEPANTARSGYSLAALNKPSS